MDAASQIHLTSKSMDMGARSSDRFRTSLTRLHGTNLSLIAGMSGLFTNFKRLAGFFAGGLIFSSWESGLQVIGRLQELSLDVVRTMGDMNQQGRATGEIVKNANALGISFEQAASAMRAGTRYGAQINLTANQFFKATQQAAAFGEAVGMGAERGAEMMGRLVGVAKLTPSQVGKIQREFVSLQRAIGITGDELAVIAEGITPIIAQMKNLGASTSDVMGMVQSTSNLVAGFAAIGKSAGDATQFIDRLLDPGRLNENIVLYSRLGINVEQALGAMQGQGADQFLGRIQEQLPALGRQIASMGVIPGEAFARQLGISYRDALQFQNMDSAAFKERMSKLQQERADEAAFQKQLDQTLRTWQRAFVAISNTMDLIRAKFASAFGGQNFSKLQGRLIQFAGELADIMKEANVAGAISLGLDVTIAASKALLAIIRPIGVAFKGAFTSPEVQRSVKSITKLLEYTGEKLGGMIATYLPMVLNRVEKVLNFINNIADKLGPGGLIGAAGALYVGAKVAGPVTGAVGSAITEKLTNMLLRRPSGSIDSPIWVRSADLLSAAAASGPAGAGGGARTLRGGARRLRRRAAVGTTRALRGVGGAIGRRALGAGGGIGNVAGIIGRGAGRLASKALIITAIASVAADVLSGGLDSDVIKERFKNVEKNAQITTRQRYASMWTSVLDGLTLGFLPKGAEAKVAQVLEAGLAGEGPGEMNPMMLTGTVGILGAAINGLIKTSRSYQTVMQSNLDTTLGINKAQTAYGKAILDYSGINQFGTGLDRMITKFEYWWPEFKKQIEDAWKAAWEKITSWYNNVKKQIEDALKAAWEKITFWYDSVIKKIEEVIETARKWIDYIIKNIADIPKILLQKLTEVWNNLKNWFNRAVEYFTKLFNDIIKTIQNLPELIQKKINEIIEKIGSVIKGAMEAIKMWGMRTFKSILAMFSDGWLKSMFRFIQMMENIMKKIAPFIGMDPNSIKWAADFSTQAQDVMQKRFTEEIRLLSAEGARIAALPAAERNQLVDAFNQQVKDLRQRQLDQAIFLAAPGQNRENFKQLQGQVPNLLSRIAEATEDGARSGADTARSSAATAGNTGATARHTEAIERNTQKPTRFIDIDSLAIRANESRNVYLTYSSTPTGA